MTHLQSNLVMLHYYGSGNQFDFDASMMQDTTTLHVYDHIAIVRPTNTHIQHIPHKTQFVPKEEINMDRHTTSYYNYGNQHLFHSSDAIYQQLPHASWT